MLPSSEARFAVPAVHRRRGGVRRAGWLVALGIGGIAIPAWPCRADEPPPLTMAPSAVSTAVDKPAAAHLGVAPAAATSPAISDDQRRMLLLLLMNSAGAVRPFAGLGR